MLSQHKMHTKSIQFNMDSKKNSLTNMNGMNELYLMENKEMCKTIRKS